MVAIRHKVEESAAGIVCIQETKRENFDLAYIHKICPQNLINLSSYLPLGLQVASSLLGMELSSLES